jgi:hypothetical protein
MEYYDENGDLIDEDYIDYLQRMDSAVFLNDSEVIKSFIKVEPIYLLLKNKGVELTRIEIKKVNKEFQSIKFDYGKMISIWSERKFNPFERYSFNITHQGKKYSPVVDVFPRNLEQIKPYLDFTSGWVNKTLLEIEFKDFEIYSESEYIDNFQKFDSVNFELIEKEIERIRTRISFLVDKLQLNENLLEYSNYFENSTTDISFFGLNRTDRIENIWSLAIGIGILLGEYKYSSFLNNEKRKYVNIKNVLKNGYSYKSDYSDLKLLGIYKKLVDGGYIEEMDEPNDFIKVFREEKLNKIEPIVWKKVQKRWLSILTLIHLLVNPDYLNETLFRNILGFCFTFKKGKNISEDIGKSMRNPFEKVVLNRKLDERIRKIVEEN